MHYSLFERFGLLPALLLWNIALVNAQNPLEWVSGLTGRSATRF